MSVPSKATIQGHFGALFERVYQHGDEAVAQLHSAITQFANGSRPSRDSLAPAELSKLGNTINALLFGRGWRELKANKRMVALFVDVGDASAPTVWVYPSGDIKVATLESMDRAYW